MTNVKQGEGRLTTHVLDTASGQPASGMQIELFRLESGEWVSIRTVVTNYDGRVDGALLLGMEMRAGTYRLVFHAGDYFRENGIGFSGSLKKQKPRGSTSVHTRP